MPAPMLPRGSGRVTVIPTVHHVPIPPSAPPEPPPGAMASKTKTDAQGFVEKAWQYDTAWSLIGRVGSAVDGMFNKFEHSIRVSVQGGPQADIRRVWWLACSAAFGRYRNRVKDSVGETAVKGIWNVSKKQCTIELYYATNRINQAAARLVTGPLRLGLAGLPFIAGPFAKTAQTALEALLPASAFSADPTDNCFTFFSRGPEQLTVGANWPTWLRNNILVSPPLLLAPFAAGIADLTNALLSPVLLRPKIAWVGAPCTPGGVSEGKDAQGRPQRAATLSKTFKLPGALREWPIANLFVLGIPLLNTPIYPAAVTAGVSPLDTALAPNSATESTNIAGMVTLPDDGRIITTGEKNDPLVQPPVPFVDGSTRFNAFVSMFAQVLHCPCFLPTSPPCSARARADGSGVFLYAPGLATGQSYAGLNSLINPIRNLGPVLDSGSISVADETEAEGACDPLPVTETELTTKPVFPATLKGGPKTFADDDEDSSTRPDLEDE